MNKILLKINLLKKNAKEENLALVAEWCTWGVAFFLPFSLNAVTIFLAVGVISWFLRMFYFKKLLIKRTCFDFFIFLYLLWTLFSVFVSSVPDYSFYNYYNLMARYILLYYFIANNIPDIRRLKNLVWVMFASACCVVFYGFYQYLNGIDMSAFDWIDKTRFTKFDLRIFSTWGNPNLLAGFLVVMMALAIGLGLDTDKVKRRWFMLAIFVIFLVCLMLTYSRGEWLAICVVLAVYGILYTRKFFLLFLMLPFVLLGTHNSLQERFLSIANPYMDSSSALRIALWHSTLNMIKAHPVFGIGWGMYWFVYPNYDYFMKTAGLQIYHAHNMYLHIAAESGVLSLIFFLIIFIGHIFLAWKKWHQVKDIWLSGLMLGILSALIGFMVIGLTDYLLINVQMAMLFWFLLSLVVAVKE